MSDKNQNEVLITQQSNNELESLEHKVNCLLQEKQNMETDFGYRRARFKEIMLKKEEEMLIDKEQANKKIQELEDQLKNLQKELDENKSLLMVSQLQKENEIDYYKDCHRQQIDLMRSKLTENLELIKAQYDQEIEQLKKLVNDKNSNDMDVFSHSLKSPQPKNESMFTVVTKSFRQKVGSLNTSSLLNSSFDDKQQTRLNNNKEQEEEFDFLVPLEEETKMLKVKLRNTDKKLNSYEQILKILMNEFGIERICELINASSKPDEVCETVNKFKEEFINKKNLETSIQLDDKDSILANLLCEQAKLRNENEKLLKRINQLVNSKPVATTQVNNNNNNDNGNCNNSNGKQQSNKEVSNQLIVPALNLVNKLRKTQSLINFNRSSSNLESNKTSTNEQIEFKNSIKTETHKLTKSCEMCTNYELQLQSLQASESDYLKKIDDYDKLLKASKQDLIKEQDFRLQMEDKFIQQAKDCEQTIEKLQTKLATANYEINQLKNDFNNSCKCLTDKLKELKKLNDKLKRRLIDLNNENARILGNFVRKSKELQSEVIDLPQTLEDLQFYCLKIREDLISISIAKEKLEEVSKNEMMLLKEEQKSEYLSEKRLVESLISENEELKVKLSSAEKELNNLKILHNEHEALLKENSTLIQNYGETINQLQNLTANLTNDKVQLEKDNIDLKSRLQKMQLDLDEMESVQKDFVKLSQSLQIELEKIRQADCEVRWQHVDDVTDCNNCKKFLSKKDKTNCAHCGKIYCSECSNKIVLGGPMKNRRFKVCNICHTLLDQKSAPYFSTVPQNPT